MPRPCWLALTLVTLFAIAHRANAGFVVFANTSGKEMSLILTHPGTEPRVERLAPLEVRTVPIGRESRVSIDGGGESIHYRLEPYTAYVLAQAGGKFALQGIELAVPLPKPDDVPAGPPVARKPIKMAVRVMVDDAEPRVRAVWEKSLRQRVAAVSGVFEKQLGVVLEIAEVSEWVSDARATATAALLKDFEQQVKPEPTAVAIGFSSRAAGRLVAGEKAGLGCTRGPLHTHVLIREAPLATEAEKAEVLAHELAHLLGAAHSPDQFSVMRPVLGDGKARLAKFRIGLDPLNALAVGIWVEELRSGQVRGWDDLRPVARERLAAVYKTIAHALPEDPVARTYVALLDRHAAPAARAPELAAPALTARQEAVRKVVRAVTIRAADLARRPVDVRLKGDALTAEYVRTAASVAATEEEALRPAAFLIGLGLALDHSTTLRDNPLTRTFCRPVESAAERQERLDVLGSPTMRGRRDLCQHFVVSAALAELLDPAAAEAAGLLKERLDMAGDSGFSFADLAADFAGVELARTVRRDPRAVARMSIMFEVADHVPDVTGLPEGLSKAKFEDAYGSEADPRFKKALEDIRKRISDLPAYK
jgi:hypothetical protein